MVEIKEQSWAKMNELELKNWDDYRKPYASVIKNLLNNIDICSRRYIEEDEKGYLVQIDKYKKEIEELKAHIKKEENIDNG